MRPKQPRYRMQRRTDRILAWVRQSVGDRVLDEAAVDSLADDLARVAPAKIGMAVAREQIRVAIATVQLKHRRTKESTP